MYHLPHDFLFPFALARRLDSNTRICSYFLDLPHRPTVGNLRDMHNCNPLKIVPLSFSCVVIVADQEKGGVRTTHLWIRPLVIR
jgi:hypothetical protein